MSRFERARSLGPANGSCVADTRRDGEKHYIAMQCLMRPTAGQSAPVSLDPDVRSPLSIEIYFHLHIYEIEQSVFERNLICL